MGQPDKRNAKVMGTTWHEPVEGFQYSPDVVSVSREFQNQRLQACGLDPADFGNFADPAFFIGIGIHAGVNSGISAEGNVNMIQRLIQHRLVNVDEQLTVQGKITDVQVVPRGLRVNTDVWFEDEGGARVMSTPRISLKPDPNASARGAGDRPAPAIEDLSLTSSLSTHQLTPEAVVGYSSEGNSIHYDMDAAQKAGFRAPIIGGGMGVHYLTRALFYAEPPAAFDMGIVFRRPIFWDDGFEVVCQGDPNQTETWTALALVRDGKPLTEASLSFVPGNSQ
jgi:hypothetical protein